MDKQEVRNAIWTKKEMLDALTYNRDRLLIERGSDYSGVKALNAAIEMMALKVHESERSKEV